MMAEENIESDLRKIPFSKLKPKMITALAEAGKWIIDPAKRSMEEHLLPIYRNKIDIVPSALLKKNIAILGAAALIFKRLDNKTGK